MDEVPSSLAAAHSLSLLGRASLTLSSHCALPLPLGSSWFRVLLAWTIHEVDDQLVAFQMLHLEDSTDTEVPMVGMEIQWANVPWGRGSLFHNCPSSLDLDLTRLAAPTLALVCDAILDTGLSLGKLLARLVADPGLDSQCRVLLFAEQLLDSFSCMSEGLDE